MLWLCILLSIIIETIVCQHHSSLHSVEDLDRELHDHQIPPPYQQPSHEDITNILTQIFTSDIDKNGDGFATEEELKNWIEIVHKKLIKDNVDQQWSYYEPEVQEVHSWEGYNPEKKEVLDWQKYINLTYPQDILETGDQTDPNHKNMRSMYVRAERRWKLADKNLDSVLDKEEYKDFVHPEESDRTQDILIDEAMEDMDKDVNDEISIEEYMNHLRDMTTEEEKNDPNWVQVQQTHFTAYLDKNKDLVLNKEELKEWLVPTYDRHEAEALRLISMGDQNQDNKLSKDELIKNQEQYLSLIPPEFWNKFSDFDSSTEPTIHDEF